MSSPRVTIILPTLDQGWFLPYTLASIEAQVFRDFELICVDDGCTDDTPLICTMWEDRPWFSWGAHDNNEGTARAINTGFQRAEGSLITWISSDNLYHPHWLSHLVGRLDSNPDETGAAYGGFDWVRVSDRQHALNIAHMYAPPFRVPSSQYMFTPHDPQRQISQEACYYGPAFLIRREVWQPHRGKISHDLDNWLRVEEACWERGLDIVGVDRSLCTYLAGDWRVTKTRAHEYDAPRWLEEARGRRGV